MTMTLGNRIGVRFYQNDTLYTHATIISNSSTSVDNDLLSQFNVLLRTVAILLNCELLEVTN